MIVILNRFREDAVLATIQDEYGRMNSFTMDFPEERDPKAQMAMTLADLMQFEAGWGAELMNMVEQNNQAIERVIEEFTKDMTETEGYADAPTLLEAGA